MEILYDRAVRILISSAERSAFVGETIDGYTNDYIARV